jgi:hypothetical protein
VTDARSQWPLNDAVEREFRHYLRHYRPGIAAVVAVRGWDALTAPDDMALAIAVTIAVFQSFGVVGKEFWRKEA